MAGGSFSVIALLHNEVETRTSENELDTIRHSEYIDIENLKTNCEKKSIKYFFSKYEHTISECKN